MKIVKGQRLPGMGVTPDRVDEYLKETFGLTNKELQQLSKKNETNSINTKEK